MKRLILTSILFLFYSQTSLAHDKHMPEEAAASESIPKDIWAYFFSSADAAATITVRNGFRYIESDGLPDHETGQFPNRNNPNRIQRQDKTYKVTLSPQKQGQTTPVPPHAFGIAVNGVTFDPATGEFWGDSPRSGWNIEALTGNRNLGLDSSNAHVQPDGTYHYHALPTGIADRYRYQEKPALLGYAADGFPIYTPYGFVDSNNTNSGMKELRSSYRIKSGHRPDNGPDGEYDGVYTQDYEYIAGLGDLDECNGRHGVTEEYPDGTYYYVITNQFPFLPRCWVGQADRSFYKSMGGSRNRPGSNSQRGRFGPDQRGSMFSGRGAPSNSGGPSGQRRGPPQEAIQACSGKYSGDHCSFEAPFGQIRGQCRQTRDGDTACVPEGHRR